MALQKKIVGRLPLFFGEYNDNTTYKSMNRVSYYGSEFQLGLGPNYEYITKTGLRPFNGEPVETVRPDGSKKWTFVVNAPWILVSDLTDAYMVSKDIDDIVTRIESLEKNSLTLKLTANPSKVFYKDTAETITLTASFGNITPSVVNIKFGDTKINVGNEMTATYNQKLTQSDNVFSAYAEYNGSSFTANLTLSSRYPVYTLFAAKDADIPSLSRDLFKKESARTTGAGTYSFKNTQQNGYCPYLLVPVDVAKPTKFSMGGAPVAYTTTDITLDDISYKAYRLGSDNGYDVGVELDIVATL